MILFPMSLNKMIEAMNNHGGQAMLDGVGFYTQKIYHFLRDHLSTMQVALLAPILWLFGLITSGIQFVETSLNELIGQGTDIIGNAVSLNAGTMLGIANYFVPLDLMFHYCALLIPLWLVALVYRTIKSFIPTLS